MVDEPEVPEEKVQGPDTWPFPGSYYEVHLSPSSLLNPSRRARRQKKVWVGGKLFLFTNLSENRSRELVQTKDLQTPEQSVAWYCGEGARSA